MLGTSLREAEGLPLGEDAAAKLPSPPLRGDVVAPDSPGRPWGQGVGGRSHPAPRGGRGTSPPRVDAGIPEGHSEKVGFDWGPWPPMLSTKGRWNKHESTPLGRPSRVTSPPCSKGGHAGAHFAFPRLAGECARGPLRGPLAHSPAPAWEGTHSTLPLWGHAQGAPFGGPLDQQGRRGHISPKGQWGASQRPPISPLGQTFGGPLRGPPKHLPPLCGGRHISHELAPSFWGAKACLGPPKTGGKHLGGLPTQSFVFRPKDWALALA